MLVETIVRKVGREGVVLQMNSGALITVVEFEVKPEKSVTALICETGGGFGGTIRVRVWVSFGPECFRSSRFVRRETSAG